MVVGTNSAHKDTTVWLRNEDSTGNRMDTLTCRRNPGVAFQPELDDVHLVFLVL